MKVKDNYKGLTDVLLFKFFEIFVKIKWDTEMISPVMKNNPNTIKMGIAIVSITFDVMRISGAEVCFLVVDESPCWFTVSSRLLFSIASSKV